MKNYRKKVFEAMPKLKALDGYRADIPLIDPGLIDANDGEKPDY